MKKELLFIVFGILFMGTAQAQDEEVEITDEELKKYAIAMDSVDAMKENIKNTMADMVSSNESMTGARYNELADAIADEAKLEELEATEEEVAFINKVKDTKDQMTSDLNSTFQALAKDFIGDGGRVYKKVKNALKSDADLKAKYKEMLAELKEARTSEDAEVENEGQR